MACLDLDLVLMARSFLFLNLCLESKCGLSTCNFYYLLLSFIGTMLTKRCIPVCLNVWLLLISLIPFYPFSLYISPSLHIFSSQILLLLPYSFKVVVFFPFQYYGYIFLSSSIFSSRHLASFLTCRFTLGIMNLFMN